MRKALPPRAPRAPRPVPAPGDPARAASGPRLSPPERREALLEAALPLFARLGWAGAGTRELSRAAGVSEPILYRHFDGKEGLYVAVLERAADRVAEVLTRRAGGVRGVRRIGALADALDEVLEQRLDELRVLAASGAAAEAPAVARAATRAFERLGRLLADLLGEAGLRRGVDAGVAAGLLLEVGLGAAVLVPLGLPLTGRDTFRAPALRLLARALTGPSGSRP